MLPRIGMVVAHDEDLGVGKDGGIPWKEPADLQFVRKVTLGSTLVMGRRTWESLGKPLPHRQHLVLSRSIPDDQPENARFFHCLDAMMAHLNDQPIPQVWIFGGAELYNNPFIRNVVGEIWQTTIPGRFECDAHLQDWDAWVNPSQWELDWHGRLYEEGPRVYHFARRQDDQEYRSVLASWGSFLHGLPT